MSRRLTGLILVTALTACGPNEPDDYPEQLSEWELMEISDGPDGSRQLVLAGDVVPYELATPLFSDYAQKLRTIRFPEDAPARYREDEPLAFPPGTVISKTFYYPRHADGSLQLTASTAAGVGDHSLDLSDTALIETRLLVRESDGWTALPYVWNAEQNEATLRIQGDIRPLAGMDETGQTHAFHYLVPNRNECGSCHITDERSGKLRLIGPTARQLNAVFEHRNGASTQLQHWAEQGWLTGLPDDPDSIPSVPVWGPSATDRTEERARAWLDINCGHCHRPDGPADNSGLFLHAAETSMARLGRCKPPVAAGRGTGGNRFSLQPGAPEQSILYHRIASTEPDVMMPELGRSLVQQEALTLISRWIAELPGACP
ncbi:MAG: SO2930 family diheme c-type cytochrome [Pseudohongiellaceae bacterium]